jgi:hypothetical protein
MNCDVIKEICIYNTERTLRLYLSAVTDIDIIIPLSYPLKWYWSRDYVDVTIHNTEQDFLMFKYMINIIWYGSFRITSRINPRPISSRELKLSGWYWCLGLIRDVIRKEPYNILYILLQYCDSIYWNPEPRWYMLTGTIRQYGNLKLEDT